MSHAEQPRAAFARIYSRKCQRRRVVAVRPDVGIEYNVFYISHNASPSYASFAQCAQYECADISLL